MSLENEYYEFKAALKTEEEKLAKAEGIVVVEDENNPFSVEDRIEAKNRAIKSHKAHISEIKEILTEVEEELIDFVKNGGDVSSKTRELFDSQRVDFEIKKDDEEIASGYVLIPPKIIEDPDDSQFKIEYWDGNQYTDNLAPYGTDDKTLDAHFHEEDFLTIICDFADDNKTFPYVDGSLLLINGGAVFEVDVKDYNSDEFDSQYYMAFTLKFNGDQVVLDERVYFEDPFTYEQFNIGKEVIYEKGAYIVEVPKIIWEDPDETEEIAEILNDYKDAFECAYRKTLIYEKGVFGIAYSFIESELQKQSSKKFFDGSYKQDWANATEEEFEDFSVQELYFMTEDDVEKVIREDYEEELSLREDAQRDYERECKEREEELKKEFGF